MFPSLFHGIKVNFLDCIPRSAFSSSMDLRGLEIMRTLQRRYSRVKLHGGGHKALSHVCSNVACFLWLQFQDPDWSIFSFFPFREYEVSI